LLATAVLVVLSTAMSVGGGHPRTAAAGSAGQSSGPNACKVNGVLVVPAVVPGRSFGWIFVANFDHAPSANRVVSCLALTPAPGAATTYEVREHCLIVNNIAGRQFGGGHAPFDGNAYLQCSITLPGNTEPPPFWVHARANLPTLVNGGTFTLLTSSEVAFTVTTSALCATTLSSRYGTVSFAHATAPVCGSFAHLESRVDRNNQGVLKGAHRVGTTWYGPSNLNGSLPTVPVAYSFQIAQPGPSFTLDWLAIDPPGSCCNPS
jgi:hypothetical protein